MQREVCLCAALGLHVASVADRKAYPAFCIPFDFDLNGGIQFNLPGFWILQSAICIPQSIRSYPPKILVASSFRFDKIILNSKLRDNRE